MQNTDLERRLGAWLHRQNWRDCEGLWLHDHGALLAVLEGGDELICGDDCWRWRVFSDPRYCTGWARGYRSGPHVNAPPQHVDPPRPRLDHPATHGVLLRLAVLRGTLRHAHWFHDLEVRDGLETRRVVGVEICNGGGITPLGEALAALLLYEEAR